MKSTVVPKTTEKVAIPILEKYTKKKTGESTITIPECMKELIKKYEEFETSIIAVEEVPSTLGIMGRYISTPVIFEIWFR